MTVAWAFDRFSFGRPLASYQAIKHRFADLKAWLEASHAVTDAAVAAVDAGADDAAELATSRRRTSAIRAPRSCTTACSCTAASASRSSTTCFFLRRLTVDRALYGTPAEHHLPRRDVSRAPRGGRMSAATTAVTGRHRRVPRACACVRARESASGRQHGDDRAQPRARRGGARRRRARPRSPAHALRRRPRRRLRAASTAGRASPAHQRVLNGRSRATVSSRIQVPTFAPCAVVLLEFGTEEQKQRHIPPC